MLKVRFLLVVISLLWCNDDFDIDFKSLPAIDDYRSSASVVSRKEILKNAKEQYELLKKNMGEKSHDKKKMDGVSKKTFKPLDRKHTDEDLIEMAHQGTLLDIDMDDVYNISSDDLERYSQIVTSKTMKDY